MKIDCWFHLSTSFLPLKWPVVVTLTRFYTRFAIINSVEDVNSLSPEMSSFFMTMKVIMKSDCWYHLSRSFLLLKWLVVIKLKRFYPWLTIIKSVEDVNSLSLEMSSFY